MKLLTAALLATSVLSGTVASLLLSSRVQGVLVYMNFVYWPFTDLSKPEEPSFLFKGVPHTTRHVVPGSDGNEISAWVTVPASGTFEGTVIYHHGNAETKAWGWAVDKLSWHAEQNNVRVVSFDYRGFGDSPGVPTEDGVVSDALAVFEWVVSPRGLGESPDRVVVHGHSLGTGISSAMLQRRAQAGLPLPAGLVLEAGFTSIADVAHSFVPLDAVKSLLDAHLAHNFDTASRIRELRLPLLIVHGNADQVVPYAHGARLAQLAQEPDSLVSTVQFVTVHGGEHDSLLLSDEYRAAVEAFVQRRVSPSSS